VNVVRPSLVAALGFGASVARIVVCQWQARDAREVGTDFSPAAPHFELAFVQAPELADASSDPSQLAMPAASASPTKHAPPPFDPPKIQPTKPQTVNL
jgi:hypothetical protein